MQLLNKKRRIRIILLVLLLTFILGTISSVLAIEVNTTKNPKLIKNSKSSTSKKKLKITTNNLNKKYGEPKKFQIKITKNKKGISNIKIRITLKSKNYYKKTNNKGIASLSISNLKIGSYKIKSVIYKNSKYYSKTNINKIKVYSQNHYKLTRLKWGSKGNINKNTVLTRNIAKTKLNRKIINICKKRNSFNSVW